MKRKPQRKFALSGIAMIRIVTNIEASHAYHITARRKLEETRNDKTMWPNKRIISALTVEANRNTSSKVVLPLEKYAKHATNKTTSRQSADQYHAHRKLNRWH